jgi:hypothetical protein
MSDMERPLLAKRPFVKIVPDLAIEFYDYHT